ncbi:tripartite tricarboxylate transporter substrate binding protein [Roseateles sp. So40a]|uniref:tripartite tricarboxylate transporter substrate binding protein n=1 Tax=Roseateles sp. So40a TaxID=3400226 RepID=UPI003A83926A
MLLSIGIGSIHPLRESFASPRACHFVVPYTTGGIMDVTGRMLAPYLEHALAEQLLVENVPGAAGVIGHHQMLTMAERVDAASLGSDSDAILAPLANPSARSITGAVKLTGVIGSGPMALVGAGDVTRVVRMLRARGELTCGNYGVDSNSHLLASEFARRTGARLTHVPYKGIAPVVQDLAGGHIDVAFLPSAGLQLHLDAGRIRLVGLCSPARSSQFLDVPTVGELFSIGDFSYETWSGLLVSRTAPASFAERCNAGVRAALASDEFRRSMEKLGATLAAPMSIAEAEDYFRRAVASALLLRGG